MLCTGAFAPNTRNESVKWSLFILILGWCDPYEILIMLLIKLSCNVRPNFCSHCKKFDIKGFLHSIVFTVFFCVISGMKQFFSPLCDEIVAFFCHRFNFFYSFTP